jgi:hypothetical protein
MLAPLPQEREHARDHDLVVGASGRHKQRDVVEPLRPAWATPSVARLFGAGGAEAIQVSSRGSLRCSLDCHLGPSRTSLRCSSYRATRAVPGRRPAEGWSRMKRRVAFGMLPVLMALLAFNSAAFAQGPAEQLRSATMRVLGALQDRALRESVTSTSFAPRSGQSSTRSSIGGK